MSDVQIAVIDQQDTQIVLAVPGVQGATGSSIPSGGTTDQVLRKNSSTDYDANWAQVTSAMIANGTIVNDDINNSAAIAGTKISPDFGSQNSVTTGTSTAASFIPTSSTAPTNGVYLPSANNVAISTGGSGKLFVNNAGEVDVSSANARLYITTTGTNTAVATLRNASYYYNINLDGANGGLTFYNGTERLRITSAGLVGVGTTTPESYKDEAEQLVVSKAGNCGITVASATNGVGALYFADGTSGSDASRGGLYYSHIDNSMQLLADGSARVYITSGGLVGIGTTPDSPLHVVGTSGTGLRIGYTNNTNYFDANTQIFRSNNATTTYGQWDSSGRLLVGTPTSLQTDALIQSSKTSGSNVIYASTTLGNDQSCRFQAIANARSASVGVFQHSSIASPAGYIGLQEVDGTEDFLWVDDSGNFRISATISHIGTTSGTVVGTQTSDERLKNVLGPVEYGLNTIKQIEPVRYALKSEPDVEKLGFIAQQVLPVVPQSVFDTGEEIADGEPTKLGMEYVSLIPVLVNAIKELSAEVDALKAQLQ